MSAPLFVQRLSRLPEVVDLLRAYPEGLPLPTLADRFGVTADVLQQDLLAYLDLESWGWGHDVFRRPAIEFVSPDGAGEPTDGGQGLAVRLVPDAEPGLGVEHLSAGDLALVHTAGQALLEVDPGDIDLAEALAVLAETTYGAALDDPAASQPGDDAGSGVLALLQQAQEQHRRVRVEYSRAWRPGVGTRVVEPLRLLQTRRGWELDAGPVDAEGGLRTFLLDQLRSVEVLGPEETFTPPARLAALLEAQRRTTVVRLEVPQAARWAVDEYAERVAVVEQDDATVTADLDLLPPVAARVALVLLAGGPTARVVSPGSVLPAALAHVAELHAHHAAAPR